MLSSGKHPAGKEMQYKCPGTSSNTSQLQACLQTNWQWAGCNTCWQMMDHKGICFLEQVIVEQSYSAKEGTEEPSGL